MSLICPSVQVVWSRKLWCSPVTSVQCAEYGHGPVCLFFGSWLGFLATRTVTTTRRITSSAGSTSSTTCSAGISILLLDQIRDDPRASRLYSRDSGHHARATDGNAQSSAHGWFRLWASASRNRLCSGDLNTAWPLATDCASTFCWSWRIAVSQHWSHEPPRRRRLVCSRASQMRVAARESG